MIKFRLGLFPLKSKTITAKVKQIQIVKLQIVEPFNKTPKCLLALKGENNIGLA